MPIRQRLVCALALGASVVVFAQTSQTKPPDVGGSEATNSRLQPTSSWDPCRSAGKGSDQATILSDTMGVDFGLYLTRIMPIV